MKFVELQNVAGALLLLVFVAGCGPSTPKVEQGCASDNDCKSERICVDGECSDEAVDSGEAQAADMTVHDVGVDACSSTGCGPISCGSDERVRANACVPCDAGTSNSAGDDPSGDDTSCAAVLCAQDERVADNSCVACADGTSNMAGDDASGADTACDADLCASNQRVSSNACVVCAAGTTNAPGDDASGADTDCDVVYCAANQRVSSNACVACPPGTTNGPGDDASGADTDCDVVYCAANQRVSSNICVACPAGTTNAAGDEASGSDTACDPNVWDLSADFSTVNNPNGPWTFGWSNTRTGALTSYEAFVVTNGLGFWQRAVNRDPNVTINASGAAISTFDAVWPAGAVAYHPGQFGQHSIIRWTAPYAGTFRVTGRWTGFCNSAATDTDVAILHGATTLVVAAVNLGGFGNTTPFDVTVVMGAGEEIRFTVGYGDGDFTADTTGIDAQIVVVP